MPITETKSDLTARQEWQARFVRELAAALAEGIVTDIAAGKVPARWDGIELRWLLAERAEGVTVSYGRGDARRRDYNNYVRVENL